MAEDVNWDIWPILEYSMKKSQLVWSEKYIDLGIWVVYYNTAILFVQRFFLLLSILSISAESIMVNTYCQFEPVELW